jgi:hypothetical protein
MYNQRSKLMNKVLYPIIIALFATVFAVAGFAQADKKDAAPNNSASSIELQSDATQLDTDDMREITAGKRISSDAMRRGGIPSKQNRPKARSGNHRRRPCSKHKRCRS